MLGNDSENIAQSRRACWLRRLSFLCVKDCLYVLDGTLTSVGPCGWANAIRWAEESKPLEW